MDWENEDDFIITREDYKRAKEHGVSKQLLHARFYYNNWDKEKAIVTPPRTSREKSALGKYYKIADENNIPRATFRSRVYTLKWTPEEACTRPLVKAKDRKRKRKYPLEAVEKAKSIGVNYNTFVYRLRKGWTIEEATTTPVIKKGEILAFTRKKLKERRSKGEW